jgi:16S rRNA (cytosine967-C5)-methyltransferase
LSSSPELAAVFAAAAPVVGRVLVGSSLASQPAGFGLTGPPRGATVDMVFGTLRRYGRGDAILARLAHKGLPDPQIRALLLCALHAIESGNYAAHVAVDQAVRACDRLRKSAAKRFVNGVLRTFLREREEIAAALEADPVARMMHPAWWIETVRQAYPAQWESVLSAGNVHPPMTLRVNQRKSGTDDYLARLECESMRARRLENGALMLEVPVNVDRLPGFADGAVSVQDAGAQRAAGYLDLATGQRVLDACAAPGGKASHVLEVADVELLALDVDPARCERIRQTFSRLGLQGRVLTADCLEPGRWWDGRGFDRILADVPCTASGIARRHPDIKWLRRPGDPARFAAAQLRILEALWRVLAPGGKLLYVTCSVFPEENAAVVDAFCTLQGAARRLDLPGDAPPQLLPGAENDGFYFALLQK